MNEWDTFVLIDENGAIIGEVIPMLGRPGGREGFAAATKDRTFRVRPCKVKIEIHTKGKET